MQMFYFSSEIPKILPKVQIAIVINQSDGESQFGEIVAANRGARSRIFESLKEAQSWLER